MWGKKEDGEGYSVVLYYRLTDEAKDDLRQNLTPAARLLKTFTANVGEERWHGRYKSIPKIMNPDDCEVGRTVRSLIQSYNAKPFLTGPWCHSFIKGPGYVEVRHHHRQSPPLPQPPNATRSRTHPLFARRCAGPLLCCAPSVLPSSLQWSAASAVSTAQAPPRAARPQ